MKKGSAYWLSHTPTEKFNLIELAHTQRAISNFVKILTKEEIPVEFFEYNDGESMTDGKKIAISSTINLNNIDSVVGLVLHEGAHCKHTNFKILKKISNRLPPRTSTKWNPQYGGLRGVMYAKKASLGKSSSRAKDSFTKCAGELLGHWNELGKGR